MNFKNVKYENVYELLKICKTSEVHEIDFLLSLYNKSNTYFEVTLQFCLELGLLIINSSKLFLSKNIDIEEMIVRQLVLNKLKFQKLNEFLNKFVYDEEGYTFYPSIKDKIYFADERNFLLSAGALSTQQDAFILLKKYSNLLFKREMSLLDLHEIIKQKEKAGEETEKYVLSLEKSKASKYTFLPYNAVKHISNECANAGYDIISFDKCMANLGEYKKIFIEVKCVDDESCFYWSKNEVSVASQQGAQYYLYLVKRPFLEENVDIINNPFVVMFDNKDWTIDIEQYRIKRSDGGRKRG